MFPSVLEPRQPHRRRARPLFFVIGLTAFVSTFGCGDDGGVAPGEFDSDGDFISDADEGAAQRIDTDADGVPDFLSIDSDRDGIRDRIEAGDMDLTTVPVDSDDDGVPDFRDNDSDGNGRLDAAEGATGAEVDTDGDGVFDFADIDDDGDGLLDVVELGANPQFPRDSDFDDIPDFQDPDSDNDTILDGFEGTADSDGDGILDRFDNDSDDDGLSDSLEAGDDDLETAPFDNDNDGQPDFLDPDSDNDGLPDGLEVEEGTDRFDADSDADGASDLIEVGYGSDPNDGAANPRASGDFVFLAPFGAPPVPRRDTLRFRTSIRFADVYFLFDTTGSMRGEIDAVRSTVETVLDNLSCRETGSTCGGDIGCGLGEICDAGVCIEDPEITGCVRSLWTGVGAYEGDEDSYANLLSLQPDASLTRSRIPDADGGGADETLFESTACIANPTLCDVDCSAGDVMAPPLGAVGCPSFRPGAVRLVVAITDEPNQCDDSDCPTNTAAAVGSAFIDNNITFVGIDADSTSLLEPGAPRQDLTDLALLSESLDSARRPLVFPGDGTFAASAVTAAIQEVTGQVPLFAVLDQRDEPGDDGDALRFIERVEVNVSGGECTEFPSSVLADLDGDGFDDAIAALSPGTPACWNVVARRNEFVPPLGRPQIFQAALTVLGDESVLDARQVFFLVPPDIPDVVIR